MKNKKMREVTALKKQKEDIIQKIRTNNEESYYSRIILLLMIP